MRAHAPLYMRAHAYQGAGCVTYSTVAGPPCGEGFARRSDGRERRDQKQVVAPMSRRRHVEVFTSIVDRPPTARGAGDERETLFHRRLARSWVTRGGAGDLGLDSEPKTTRVRRRGARSSRDFRKATPLA